MHRTTERRVAPALALAALMVAAPATASGLFRLQQRGPSPTVSTEDWWGAAWAWFAHFIPGNPQRAGDDSLPNASTPTIPAKAEVTPHSATAARSGTAAEETAFTDEATAANPDG